MIQKKICMLGAFAVGKTSLVERFVRSRFSEKYQTTVGVRIEKKTMPVDDATVNAIIWDIGGEDDATSVRASYLRGSEGFFFVADATRPATLDAVAALSEVTETAVGPVPRVLAVNKSDLVEAGDELIGDSLLVSLTDAGWRVFSTSAKTGHGVEAAFAWLARELLKG